jgi:hypothetical protein
MLYDFHNGGGVKPVHTAIPVHQRTLQQRNPLSLPIRHAGQLEASRRLFERPVRYVHTDNLFELRLTQQKLNESALPAPQIEDTRCITYFQQSDDGLKTFLM